MNAVTCFIFCILQLNRVVLHASGVARTQHTIFWIISLVEVWQIPSSCVHVHSYLRNAEADLGLDVAEHQISSMNLHDHLLGPQAPFVVQPLQLGHTVVQRLQLPAIQVAGQEVLGGGGYHSVKTWTVLKACAVVCWVPLAYLHPEVRFSLSVQGFRILLPLHWNKEHILNQPISPPIRWEGFIAFTYSISTSRWAWACCFSETETPWSHRFVEVASAGGSHPVRIPWSLTKKKKKKKIEITTPSIDNIILYYIILYNTPRQRAKLTWKRRRVWIGRTFFTPPPFHLGIVKEESDLLKIGRQADRTRHVILSPDRFGIRSAL